MLQPTLSGNVSDKERIVDAPNGSQTAHSPALVRPSAEMQLRWSARMNAGLSCDSCHESGIAAACLLPRGGEEHHCEPEELNRTGQCMWDNLEEAQLRCGAWERCLGITHDVSKPWRYFARGFLRNGTAGFAVASNSTRRVRRG